MESPNDAVDPAGRRAELRTWVRAWKVIGALLAVWVLGAAVAAPLLLPRLPADGVLAQALAGWRGSLRDGVLILAGLAAVVPAFSALRAASVGRWVRPATAEGLGALRMWIAAILLANVLWEDLASSAWLPRAMLNLEQHWLVDLLYRLPIGFDRFLASWGALRAFETLTALLLAAALAGLWSRWTVPAGALAYLLFASILRGYAWSYHMGLVPLYALLLLSLTPCGDAWSADRWLGRRRGLPVEPARVPRLRYGVGRYLVWMGVAIPYTLAGLSKLRNTGPLWWQAEHMKQMVVATVVEPMQFDFRLTYLALRGPDWLFDVLGLAALAGEVTFALVLVSRLARRWFPAIMAGMHVGILLMQNILFPDLIAIQAIFYDWSPLRARLVAWWAAARRVLPDGLAARPAPAPALAGAGPVPAVAAASPAALSGDGGDGGDGLRDVAPGTTTTAPPRGLDSITRRQAFAARAFLVAAFVVWATRTERFPLTAMQMYSRPFALEPVEYVRPMVVYEDGAREPARFERWIGAVADGRFRWLLRDWDRHPERIALLHEFLDACAERANAAAPPGRRIRGFELELRRWDFRRYPEDPERATVLSVVRHPVAETVAGR